MVDVVVLSGDLALYEAIRHAVGERNPVWRARSAEESVDLLLTGRCGVLLIDMAAVSTRPATLVEQIVDQFPDVVVVVAGRREDESMLAGLVSDGLVYRFMHKPLSPKRAGMFLNAAIRSHVERREGRAGERLLPLVRELRSRVDPRKWIFVGAGLALFLALLAGVLVSQFGRPRGADPTPAGGSAATAPSTGPLADPVLSRARAALAAGRYEAPPGRNALDLYSAVLLTNPDSAEAHKGLQTTIARLLADAEGAADSGDAAEARRIADRVLQVDADNAGARALLAGLVPKPRQAAVTHPTPRANPALETGAAPTSAAPVPAAGTGAIPVQQPPAPVAAVAPARPAPNAVTVVRPDPLMPRVVGPGVLPTSPSRKPQPVSRSFGAPASSGHPTAGYVERTPATMASGAPAVIPELRTSASVQQRDLEPVTTPDPAYPPQAFREGVEGWVDVEFTVTERGTTRDIEVVGAEPRAVFDDAAIAAVTNWSYRPRVVNGQPVAQRLSVTLRFNVDD
jgi:protein TonB